ncbi:MAG: folate family ECF transporter S component [Ruminococcaceae bacterium]|nr:folate family ECF transporter S component [Oscillospiraceae bacterium]
MKEKAMNQEKIFTLCYLGILIAIQVVLARFAVIPVGDMMRFSLSFIPVVIAARKFGILASTAVYGLGDLVGAIAFPTGGAFFPGYTLTAAVVGLIFGLFLRPAKKEESTVARYIKIVLSVLSTQLVGSFLMNSFWRSFQTGTPYGAVLMTRLPQCLVSAVIQSVFMILFLDRICKVIKLPHGKSH